MRRCIDVILPTYNGEKYCREQIESILSQEYKELNLIISDDASTDGTLKILRELEPLDDRISVYSNKTNIGLKKNLEFLISRCTSELIAFADQDDIWHANKLLLSQAHMEKEKARLVFTDLELVDETGGTICLSKWKFTNTPGAAANSVFASIFKSPYTGCTFLIEKASLHKLFPIPDGLFVHDKWIGTIMASKGYATGLPFPTIKYRQHSSNVTGSYRFGIKGLRKRVKKQSNGKFLSYLNFRSSQRVDLIEHLVEGSKLEAREDLKDLKRLLRIYSGSPRVLFTFDYVKYIFLCFSERKNIGLRNILVEISMTTLGTITNKQNDG